MAGDPGGYRRNKNLRDEKIWSPERSDLPLRAASFHANPRACRSPAPISAPRPSGVDATNSIRHWSDALPAMRELRPDQRGPVRAAGLAFARAGDWLVQRRSRQPGDRRCPRPLRCSTAGLALARGRAGRRPAGAISGRRRRHRGARGLRRGPAETLRAASEPVARGLAAARVRGDGDAHRHAVRHAAAGRRFAASPLFPSRRRIGTMLMLAAGRCRRLRHQLDWARGC